MEVFQQSREPYSYIRGTPLWMWVCCGLLAILAALVLGSALYSSRGVLQLFGARFSNIQDLGSLGDFFGGHISSCIGSVTLLVVLFFSYHQSRQQQDFFSKQEQSEGGRAILQFMLQGVDQIAQWELSNPGSDQALRLIDYYSRVSLKYDEPLSRELLLILNAAITGAIKRSLGYSRSGDGAKLTTYPFAFEALGKIESIREEEGRVQKARAKGKVGQ